MQKPLSGFSDGDSSPVRTSNAAAATTAAAVPTAPSRPLSSSSPHASRPPLLAAPGPDAAQQAAADLRPLPRRQSKRLSAADLQASLQSSSARSRRTTSGDRPSSKQQPRNGTAYIAPLVPPAAAAASSSATAPSAACSSGRPATSSPPLVSSIYTAENTTGSYAIDDGSQADREHGCETDAAGLAKYAGCITVTSIMDKAARSRPGVRSKKRSRNPWSISSLALVVSLLGAVLLGLIFNSLVSRQLDPKGCRMAYMYPSYRHIADFDTEHTRFASKYSLYLYREDGFDDKTKLRGIPVLFIPGNAGSYKQVRPIAGEAAQYFHNIVQHDEAALRNGARPLDFFTVDFNEDITAFHGQTLLDQAEYLNEAIRYILSLYLDPSLADRDSSLPDPTSVIVLGHSMGGIVARTMLIMPNYQSNSINTIVTLSAPHARPPVTFDSEIVKIYDDINDYWRRAYSQKWANNNPLWHVTLVSIAGGGLDTVVPSDYASVHSLVPETHGFTVFTTTIPNVWTSMDHQAILWCDQFRKAMARTLFDVVNVHRATQTKPRAERMRVFRKHFLTGLETVAEKDMPAQEHTTLLTLDDSYSTMVSQGERLTLRKLGSSPRPHANLLPIPPPGSHTGKRFTLLTDQRLDGPGEVGKIDVLFCSVFPVHASQAGAFPIRLDLSGETSGSTRLACKNATADVIALPASRRTSRYAFSLDERDSAPFSYLQYNLEQMVDYQFVAVIDKATVPTPGFVVAEFTDKDKALRTQDVGLRHLLSFGLRIRLPANHPMVTDIRIPAVQSSLLAWNLEIDKQFCAESSAELFAPLVRQYMSEPFESKFFVNAHRAGVSVHGIAPYMPPALTQGRADESGLGLQLWADPTCNSSVQIRLTIDIMGSLGKLYMRYRTVFAAFPTVIVALVLQKQFRVYDETGIFISFSEGLDGCLRKSIPLVLASLTLMSLSAGGSGGPGSGGLIPWYNMTTAALDFHRNDLLTGTHDPFFWFLTPLIGVICVAVCTVLNYTALALTHILSMLLSVVLSRPAWLRHDRRSVQQTVHIAGVPGTQPPQQLLELHQLQLLQTQLYFTPAFIQSSPRRRVVTTMVLLLLVSTFIPYQFAYLVACLIQVGTAVRALRAASDLRSTINYNFYNYVHSILMLMLWILPINLPTLVVWVRNLAVRWLTPFSSHHNVLSITPFVVLVEALTTGRMVPRVTSRLRHVTSLLLFCVAVCAAVYGVSYAYMVHYLVNVVVAWLIIVHSTGEPGVLSATLAGGILDDASSDGKQGKTP